MFFWRGDGGSGRRNGNWGNGVVECDADRMGRPRGKSAIWRVHHRGGGGGGRLLNPNLLPALDRDVDRPPPSQLAMIVYANNHVVNSILGQAGARILVQGMLWLLNSQPPFTHISCYLFYFWLSNSFFHILLLESLGQAPALMTARALLNDLAQAPQVHQFLSLRKA